MVQKPTTVAPVTGASERKTIIVVSIIVGMVVVCTALVGISFIVFRKVSPSYETPSEIKPKLEAYYDANSRYPASLKELEGVRVDPSLNYASINSRGSITNHYGNVGASGNEGVVCGYELYLRTSDSFGLNPGTKDFVTKSHC